MHRILALVVVVGCGGSPGPAPATPTEPAKPVEQVALGGTGDDPCDGGEIAKTDPCSGGEAKDRVAIADPKGDDMEGGLGVRGTGPGGGGTGSGPGLGSIGSIGSGAGQGTSSGYGAGGSRRSRVPMVTYGVPTITGKLAAQVIQRAIRQHTNQIRYCYEKLLVQRADAAGVLTLELVITPEGTVARAKATGVAPDLEACVSKHAMSWVFPRPKAGIVKVTYPLTFVLPSGT